MNFGSIPFGLQPQGPFLNQVQPSRYTQWNNPARNSSTQHRSLNGHTGNHQGIHFGNIDGSLPKNTNHLYQQLHHTGQQIHPQSGGFGIPNCGLPNGIRQAPQQYHHSGQQLPHQFGFANNTHHTGKPLQHSLQHQPTPQGESGLRGPPPVGSTNFHDGRTNGADPQHCQVDSHHDISPPNGQHHPPPTPSNTSPNNPAPQAARKPQKPHKKTTHSHVEAGQASRSTEATGNEQQTDLPVGPTQHEIITQFLNVNNPPSKSSPLVQLTINGLLQPEAKLVNEDIDNRLIRVIHDQEALIGRTRATVRKPHSPRTAQSGIEHANLEGTVNGDGSKQTTTAQLQSPPTRKQKSPGTRTTAPPKQKRARKTPAAQRKARLPPLTAAERALDPSSSESDSKTRNSFSVIQDSSSQSDHLSESGHRRSCENEDSTASNQSHSNEVATPAICKKWRPKKVDRTTLIAFTFNQHLLALVTRKKSPLFLDEPGRSHCLASPSRLTTSTVPGSSNKGSPNSIIQPPISAPPLIASSAAVWDQPNRAALLT
ncbi:hypothetical protein PtA15_5A841 [Puccinia triticina]|uniref:MADS-box domain-containing protein n=1 Tax=Puccinia triticina TaxID=208348 RepID=A0ABY7CJ60_9BASI|nr:uncharacterized protein PtA15_5A841 [Puccinia triticina]WAQ85266.1 hypothetical protein PtA15_5A841 [Puccinia triticina]